MISRKDIYTFTDRRRVLLQTDAFICLRPHFDLREYISGYHITFPAKALMPDSFTEIPCACASLSIEADNRNLLVYLDGPSTKPHLVGNRVNQLELLITIEFRPAGLYALTGIDQNELTDASILFESIHPKLSKHIADIAEKTKNINALAAGLDTLFLQNMSAAYHPHLLFMLESIVQCSGNLSVKTLSDNTHYSERQLNRIFKQHVGMGAKSFARLIRIHNSFSLLKKHAGSITLISDTMGFYDTSHFIRDFKAVCGITPREYRSNMSDFYINTSRF